MVGPPDDDAHAATLAPAVDPAGATMASAGTGTLASVSGAPPRANGPSISPDDATSLAHVDPSSYVRGKTLAVGGMGRIVAAHDRRLDRPVAIKEVRAESAELRRRFVREAKLTARLQHPNIITVHEAGVWPDGEPFFAMKLVAGRSLDKVVASKTSLDERLALLPSVIAVADALAFAHRERVIHRDLKPANVLVGDFGETVVIDWGLAKDLVASEPADEAVGPYRAAQAGAGTETAFGAVLGTPAYMPPEQARGEQVDERADVYALGAMLYHVLSGHAPVEGPTVEDVLEQVIAKPVPPVRSLEPRIPLELDTIIAKAMAPEAADRYPTAVELAEDLRRFQTGQLVGAHHYTPWQLVQRWIRRRRTPLAIAAVALVVLAVGGAYSVSQIYRERDAAETSARNEADSARSARDSATKARAAAEALLVESGRREALDHRPLRALALLREALLLADGGPAPELRFLLARVLPFAETIDLEVGAGVTHARYSADEHDVFTVSTDGHLRAWNARTGKPDQDLDEQDLNRSFQIGPTLDLAILDEGDHGSIVDLHEGTTTGDRFYKEALFNDTGSRAWMIGMYATVGRVGSSADLLSPWTDRPLALRAHGDDLEAVTATDIIRLRDTGSAIVLVSQRSHHVAGAERAVISADLERVVVGGSGQRVVYLNGDGTVAGETDDLIAGVLAISDDGRVVATIDKRFPIPTVQLRPWLDASLGASSDVPIPAGDGIDELAFSADGTALLATDPRSQMFVIDTHRAAIRATLSAEVGVVESSISHDGTHVLAALVSGTAQVWDISRAHDLPIVGDTTVSAAYDADDRVVTFRPDDALLEGHPRPIDARELGWEAPIAIDPTGHRIARAGEGLARVFDLAHPDAPVASVTVRSPKRIALAPGGHRMAVLEATEIAVFDDGVRTATWQGADGDGDNVFEFNADGSRLLQASTEVLKIVVIETATGAPTTIDLQRLVVARWSPDGTRIVAGTADGDILTWTARDGQPVGKVRQLSAVADVAFAPDSVTVYSAGVDGVVRQWDATGQPQAMRVTGSSVTDLAIDPRGELFATASSTGEVAVFSARTGDKLTVLAESSRSVGRLAFSPDGSRVLLVERGLGIKQWDTRLDAHTPDEISRLVDRFVPWRVVDGRLVPKAR